MIQETILQCLTLTGVFVREWNMDSIVKYLKVIGGTAGKEQFLVGLQNGKVSELHFIYKIE